MTAGPKNELKRSVPSGPAWIGAIVRFSGDGGRGSATTGVVLVPPGASEVTLIMRHQLAVEGRLSTELLAKSSDLHLRVRPVGATLDLEIGRGPLGASSPIIPIDRQGRFEFEIPAGAYECRVHNAAGSVLKTVRFQAPLAEDKTLVIE